ncbi:hypothetical protein NHH03_06165 [Stieleria sp. TO1_6]|uniref:hypothetical protein n=1 Tax=Stieleria tagensis TaxID=2956795 RepID=UPI00209B57BE|nr:hypothetical protein [Stieleria tagensis]MCO8121315.1 hypothetical protein [Stieleria tagensis]
MSSYNDLFVATIALIGSALAAAIGVGPWQPPYHLRTFAGIVDRYGKTTARAVWLLIAVVSLLAGIAIANGMRPGYAKPGPRLIDGGTNAVK